MAASPAHRLSGLLARYNGTVLRPPDAAPSTTVPQLAVVQYLRRWCLDGAGPGCSPLLRPLSAPAIAQRLRIAVLEGDPPAATRIANHLSLLLDGSLRLAEAGPAGRVALKLQTKLHDALWWRHLRDGDPWDCGWLQGSATDLCAYSPRRPTLVVAKDLSAPTLQTLRERQANYAHAVRLLIVGQVPPNFPDSLPLSRWRL